MSWLHRECDMKKEYIIIKNAINVNLAECMLPDVLSVSDGNCGGTSFQLSSASD